ncbi:unnamed protein product [Trifolium pratense]|uniref:Uncharacterized protein n=1 Tax=Trifolium pratense TaxID=57577 RepID=A0ACB0I8C7_TRIPR|nr:unnamed protein product [Trifolium pratense]
MSRAFDDVKSVNDSKELWKLIVRLKDIWTVTNGGKEHLEFLILDKQGDQIQVLLPSKICPMWKTSLKEGKTYVMKNFKVHKNDLFVMSRVHPFKLVFVGGNRGSKITLLSMPDIHHYKLHFKSFPQIMAGNF